jgi:DNA-binding NarL/FixJ family response regulator
MSAAQRQSQFITVATIDDDANIRDGLRSLLNQIDGLHCFGAYASVTEAMASFTDTAPDVLLLDVSLPGISGIDAIRSIRAQFPTVKIIMHSNYDDHEKIARSRQAGAAGYVLKNASALILCEAISTVHQGGSAWPAGHTESNFAGADRYRCHSFPTLLHKAYVFFRGVRSRLRY